MKKTISFLLAVLLILSAGLSLAEAKHVRPLELPTDIVNPENGEFWFETDPDDKADGASFTMNLYLEDRYSIVEVEALEHGDTVEVDGKTYTVDVVVIHGWYDSDGDGDLDIGNITVRDPETAQYLLEKYETVVSDQEMVPEAYEIYIEEDFEGYISLSVGNDGYCHPVVNDRTFRRKVGTAEVPLPLPDGFQFHYEVNWERYEGGTKEFTECLTELGFYPHCSLARFEEGNLMEAWEYTSHE